MSRVPARPTAVVPARVPQAQAANPAVAAAAPIPAAAAPAQVPVAQAAPVAASAPVAAEAPKKRGRKPRADGAAATTRAAKAEYPGLYAYNADGTVVMVDDGAGGTIPQRVKLTAIPTDFNPKIHEKLKGANFEDEAMFCDFMQQQALANAASWEKKAKKMRLFANSSDKRAASKFVKLREQMAALHAQLLAAGATEEMLADDGSND